MTNDPEDRFVGEEPNEFDVFESPAEVYAYVFRKEGEAALRQLLALPLPNGTVRTREDLLDDACELRGCGLNAVAAIITEHAAGALPMTDLSFCCYTSDVPANQRAWLRAQQQRQEEREWQREQRLKNIPQVRSSRRLEREASRNLELIWLLKKLRPGYRTIANFRKENWEALKAANRRFVLLVRELGLVGRAVVAIDGAFFHGDASKASIFTRKRLAEQIANLDREIEAYGRSLEDNDAAEARHRTDGHGDGDGGDGGDLGAKVAALMAKRSRAIADLDRLKASGETQLSRTDPDARLLSKGDQTLAGYNVQAAVDDKHKLIVASEVVNDSSDVGQLHAMAKAAKDALEAEALHVLADEGYYSSLELKACEDDGIVAYVAPSEGNGKLEKQGRFSRKDFSYEATADAYRCPAGASLYPMKGPFQNTSGRIEIRYASRKAICDTCQLRARCLSRKATTRIISRWEHEDVLERHRRRRRVDAPSFRDCRASLWYPQMPRRLPPFPGARLQQGSRRMEPDGALLQFHRVLNILGFERFVACIAEALAMREYALTAALNRIQLVLGALWTHIVSRRAISRLRPAPAG
jgi:hypothetical protein